MNIRVSKGNGQGQCALCKKRGIYNLQWMCFLYEIDHLHGVYCRKCVDEITEHLKSHKDIKDI